MLMRALFINLENRFQAPVKPLQQFVDEEQRSTYAHKGASSGTGTAGAAGTAGASGATGATAGSPAVGAAFVGVGIAGEEALNVLRKHLPLRTFKVKDLALEMVKPDNVAKTYSLLTRPAQMAGPVPPPTGFLSSITCMSILT